MSSIRPAHIEDAAAMARLHVDTWRTTYRGIISEQHLANLSSARSQARWEEFLSQVGSPSCAFVAEDKPGLVVGLASGGVLREALQAYDGELYVLYVLKAYQGKGHGRRLVGQVARWLAAQGMRSLVIWVLKDNPACGFYERLGGQRSAEKMVEIGGQELVDIAYTWDDLAELVNL